MARQTTRCVYVEVDLDDFSDEQIKEEFERRDLSPTNNPLALEEEVERLYDALCDGRHDDLKLILEKHLKPRWASLQSCQADYLKSHRARLS